MLTVIDFIEFYQNFDKFSLILLNFDKNFDKI